MSREHGNYVTICAQEKRANVTWISTNKNMSDIMAKPLPRDTHNFFLRENYVQ